MQGGDEYLETSVMTATPHQLHSMVVSAAIRFAVQAEQALEESDHEAAHFALNNSRDFVSELIAGLDQEQSPELVDQLKGLFYYVYRNLVQADLHHDCGMVRDALSILRIHRDTWNKLSEKLKQEYTDNIPVPKSAQHNSWVR